MPAAQKTPSSLDSQASSVSRYESGEKEGLADSSNPVSLLSNQGLSTSGASSEGQTRANTLSKDSLPKTPQALRDELVLLSERVAAEAGKGTAEGNRNAIQLLGDSLRIAQTLGDVRKNAEILLEISQFHINLGEPDAALQQRQLALPLAQEAGLPLLEAQCLFAIGEALSHTFHYELAREYFDRALPLAKTDSLSPLEVDILYYIALGHEHQGELQEAIERYRQLIPMFRQLKKPGGQAGVLNNLGTIFFELGDYKASLEHYSQGLRINRDIGDEASAGHTLSNIGFVYDISGDQSKALTNYQEALVLIRKTGNQGAEANTLNNLATVLLARGDLAAAEEALSRAAILGEKSQNPRIQAFTYQQLGKLYLEREQLPQSLDSFSRALELRRQAGQVRGQADSLAALASVRRKLGELSTARDSIEKAIHLLESLRTKVTAHELRTSFFSSKRNFYDFNIELLMEMHDKAPSRGLDGIALQTAERARARSLLDQLQEAEADISIGVDPALLTESADLKERLNQKEQERLVTKTRNPQDPVLEDLDREVDALVANLQRVEARIRFSSPRFASLANPEPLTLGQIQSELLDSGSLLLEYSLGDNQSFLWVVSQDSMWSYRLPSRKVIEAAALKLYSLVTFRNSSPSNTSASERRRLTSEAEASIPEAAKELAQIILLPAKQHLEKKRLVIVAEGALQYLPFSILPNPTESFRQPVIRKHEVVSLPSSTALALLRRESQRKPEPTKQLAIFADPVFSHQDSRVVRPAVGELGATETLSSGHNDHRGSSPGPAAFDRLRFSGIEAKAIASLLPENETLLALDFEASRETFLRLDLTEFRFLHFATHATLDDDHPELTGLVFSLVDPTGNPRQGYLRLHDIYNLRLNADLVTLSACRTALGKEIRGEGMIGLTRGFMYSGTTRIVASLWNVQDKATARLMKRFYQGMLTEGLQPSAALRAAQIAMLDESPWKSPYFWSGFVFQGEWRK